jgi:hypothetical protein
MGTRYYGDTDVSLLANALEGSLPKRQSNFSQIQISLTQFQSLPHKVFLTAFTAMQQY